MWEENTTQILNISLKVTTDRALFEYTSLDPVALLTNGGNLIQLNCHRISMKVSLNLDKFI